MAKVLQRPQQKTAKEAVMAKRKTAKQIAASRLNIKKAQIVSARKRSRKATILKGVAIGAVVAGAAVTARKAYNNQYMTFYHTTTHHKARMIMKNGYDGTKSPTTMGYRITEGLAGHTNRVFMLPEKSKDSYGPARIKIRVKKKDFQSPHPTRGSGYYRGRSGILPDYNDWPDVQYSISARAFEHARKTGRFKVSYSPNKKKLSQQIRKNRMFDF